MHHHHFSFSRWPVHLVITRASCRAEVGGGGGAMLVEECGETDRQRERKHCRCKQGRRCTTREYKKTYKEVI